MKVEERIKELEQSVSSFKKKYPSGLEAPEELYSVLDLIVDTLGELVSAVSESELVSEKSVSKPIVEEVNTAILSVSESGKKDWNSQLGDLLGLDLSEDETPEDFIDNSLEEPSKDEAPEVITSDSLTDAEADDFFEKLLEMNADEESNDEDSRGVLKKDETLEDQISLEELEKMVLEVNDNDSEEDSRRAPQNKPEDREAETPLSFEESEAEDEVILGELMGNWLGSEDLLDGATNITLGEAD